MRPAVSRDHELADQAGRRLSARVRGERDAMLAQWASRWQAPGALGAFVELMWPTVEPAILEWAPYMGVVCDALHRQMLGDPEYRKLLINLPPGYAKSLLVDVFAPAFEWLFAPERRKIYLSASDTVARRDSRRTRILVESDRYRTLLRKVCEREGREPWKLMFDQNEKTNFENTGRGFRQCMTLWSNFTGSRGDDLVVDDPVDVQDVLHGSLADIARRCREAQDVIDMALETRVNDRRHARRTMIMQRLHEDDPAGHAIREGGWKVLCFPLRFDPDHPQWCLDDIRSTPGELLHPTRDTESDVARLEAKLGWQAPGQLQQLPRAKDGEIFKASWPAFAHPYQCWPTERAARCSQVVASLDANVKETEAGSFACIRILGRDGRKRAVLDEARGRWSYAELKRQAVAIVAAWPQVSAFLVEDKANGPAFVSDMADAIPNVIAVDKGTKSKREAWQIYLEPAAQSGDLEFPDPRFAPWVGDSALEYQSARGDKGEVNDRLDADCQALAWWRSEELVETWYAPATIGAMLERCEPVVEQVSGLRIYNRPQEGQRYAIGTVPVWGSGPSCAVVLAQDGIVAAVFERATGDAQSFAEMVARMAQTYPGKVIVDGTPGGPGSVVAAVLRREKVSQWHPPGEPLEPWPGDWVSRVDAHAKAKRAVEADEIETLDAPILRELAALRVDGRSFVGVADAPPNLATAIALAEVCRASLPAAPKRGGTRYREPRPERPAPSPHTVAQRALR